MLHHLRDVSEIVIATLILRVAVSEAKRTISRKGKHMNSNADPVDLDGTVTPEVYRETLERVLTASRAVASDKGWCSEWIPTFITLSEDFGVGDPDDSTDYGGSVMIGEIQSRDRFTPQGWDAYLASLGYAGKLRTLRGRILQLTREDNGDGPPIDLDDANHVLRYAGLPEGQAVPPESAKWAVELNDMVLHINPGHDYDGVRDAFHAAFAAFKEKLAEQLGMIRITEEDDPWRGAGDEYGLNSVQISGADDDEDVHVAANPDDCVMLLSRYPDDCGDYDADNNPW